MNTKLSTKILENSPKIQQLESTKWIQVYDGTKKEFESDAKYDSILKDIPKDGLLIFKSTATAINPDGSTSGQWIFFYDGTKEQFEASSDYQAIIENMPEHSMLICNDGNILNPDGSINEEAIKEFIEQNYLKLSGGTLTGNLTINTTNSPRIFFQNDTLDIDDYENTGQGTSYGSYIDFRGKNSKRFATFGGDVLKNGTSEIVMTARNITDEVVKTASVRVRYPVEGEPYAICPTPSPTASNAAIYNKEALNRDFLPKSNGVANSIISVQNSTIDYNNLSEMPYSLQAPLIQSVDKNKVCIGLVQNTVNINGNHTMYMTMQRPNNSNDGLVFSSLGLGLGYDPESKKDYAFCPTYPTPDYSHKIVTFQSLQDYALKYISDTTIYVGGANASDTADLYNGRGLTTDKPFATFNAAYNFASNNYMSVNYGWLRFMLQGDGLDLAISPFDWVHARNFASIIIEGDSIDRKVSCTIRKAIHSGHVEICNMTIVANVIGNSIFECSGRYRGVASTLYLHDLKFTGTCGSVVTSRENAYVTIGDNLTGDITGQRYICRYCGCINTYGKGVNAIPGTTAGTCDESSTYV